MAKKGRGRKVAPRRPTLSDVDAIYEKVLDDLAVSRSHPNWEQAVRGVAALRDLNGVLCRLLQRSRDGESEFGKPRRP